MNLVLQIAQHPATADLAAALLHFLWQGTLLGLAALAVVAALRRAAPHVRYVSLGILFALMAASPLLTFNLRLNRHARPETTLGAVSVGGDVWSGQQELVLTVPPAVTHRSTQSTTLGRPRGAAGEPAGGGDVGVRLRPASSLPNPHTLGTTMAPWLPSIAAAWLVCVLARGGWLASGLVGIERLKRLGVRTGTRTCRDAADRLSAQLDVWRPVRVMESSYAAVPAVVGWFRPVILLPPTALFGLTDRQREAIVAHELVHIRRHDYLTNLFQSLVETLLFFHPAVWWVSERMRHERELCCDDVASQLCGDIATYVQALCTLEYRKPSPLSMALVGGSSLVDRVSRLAAKTANPSPPGGGWRAAGIVAAAVLLLGFANHSVLLAGEPEDFRQQINTTGGAVWLHVFDHRATIDMETDTNSLRITGTVPQPVRLVLDFDHWRDVSPDACEWFVLTCDGQPVLGLSLATLETP